MPNCCGCGTLWVLSHSRPCRNAAPAGQDVDQNALLLTVAKIREFLGSLYLKVVIVLSVLSAAIYGLWLLLNRWNHRRPTRKIHRR